MSEILDIAEYIGLPYLVTDATAQRIARVVSARMLADYARECP